jgi:HEPN domain-containing protein
MRPSEEQIDAWRRQAESDLRNARHNAESGAHDVCVFLCQQAAEKMLKAAYMAAKEQEAPRTHSLPRLLTELGAEEELARLSRRLTVDYMTTRYPDMTEGPPAEAYEPSDSSDRIHRAERIVEWAASVIDRTGGAHE